jgi:hypothetical protein
MVRFEVLDDQFALTHILGVVPDLHAEWSYCCDASGYQDGQDNC